MARSRNIKPGFFLNDELAALDPLARILFAGLWCIADREGRMEDRPAKIKIQVLPFDDCDVNQLLDDLKNAGFIVRYQVDGKKYIEVVNFKRHQNPHKKEAPSRFPAPPEQAPDLHSTSTMQEQEKHHTSPADSLNLIPDSGFPQPDAPDKPGAGESTEKTKPRPPFKSIIQEQRFDQFWERYPKKKSKGAAEKAWVKIGPDDLLTKRIMAGLEKARASPEWKKDNGQFIPYPASWLNAKGWEDEFTSSAVQVRKDTPKAQETQSVHAILQGDYVTYDPKKF